MAIREQINNIIENRSQFLLPKFANLKLKLERVAKFMQMPQLDSVEGWSILMNDNPEASQLWATTKSEIDTLKKRIEDEVLRIDNGKTLYEGQFLAIENRVTKGVVEICIMGPISTGKSTLMQALSGAPSYLIPTGAGKVTSARTSFRNSEQRQAIVYFYSTKEFRRIINSFVEKLNIFLTKKGIMTFSLWDEGKTLSMFIDDIKANTSYNSNLFNNVIDPEIGSQPLHQYFESFEDYINGYSQYSKYIGKDFIGLDAKQLEDGKLIPFVSYIGANNEKSYLGLLVKEAIVDWNINPELGKIILVDTMGIGEARFLIEEDLLATINSRADLGIALCKINSNSNGYSSSNRNTEFLRLLTAPTLQERQMENWIFYACNLEDNQSNPITGESIQNYKKELYVDVAGSQLPLSRNKFDAFRFGTFNDNGEVIPNKKEAYSFLSDMVLNGVENVVSSLDDYLIKCADKYLDELLSQIEQIYKKLEDIKEKLPSTYNLSDHKRINKEVDNICDHLYDEMEILSRQVEEENIERRNRVKESIFPILCKPEIFIHAIQDAERFKINISEEKSALSIFDCSSNNQEDDTDEYFDKMEAVFYVFKHMNSICEHLIKDGTPERKINFKNVFERLKAELENVEESDRDNVYDIELETLTSQKGLVEVIYKLSLRVISSLKYSMSSQTDSSLLTNGEESQFDDTVGRELKNYYENREMILKGIRKRIDSVEYTYANQSEKQSLGSYFKNETESVISRIAKALHQNIVGEKKVSNYINWLKTFAPQEDYPHLNVAINKLLQTHIDLFKIAISKQKDTYLKTLLNVNISYTNETEAAYSFYSNLFEIDYMLRMRLYEMFIDSFTDSKLYENEIMEFEKAALGMHSQKASRTDAYEELRELISIHAEEKLSTSNEYKKGKAYKTLLQILTFDA